MTDDCVYEARPGCVPDRVQRLCPWCREPLGGQTASDHRFVRFHYDCLYGPDGRYAYRKIVSRMGQPHLTEDPLAKKNRELRTLITDLRKARTELADLHKRRDDLHRDHWRNALAHVRSLPFWDRLRMLFGRGTT